jgi:hypothetical protein
MQLKVHIILPTPADQGDLLRKPIHVQIAALAREERPPFSSFRAYCYSAHWLHKCNIRRWRALNPAGNVPDEPSLSCLKED